jgi:prolyl-tRNA synthetase
MNPAMRISKTLIPTLKEAPAEAEVPSHILMVRGGYLRKLAAGIYSFLPLGWRVVQKISRIIREEMNRTGAQEVFLPAVIPGELWQESGRWDHYGDQLLRFKDRKGADFVIGPTTTCGAIGSCRSPCSRSKPSSETSCARAPA